MSGSNSWSIHIVSTSSGVKFQPWVPGSNPGDAANAQVNDIVTWGDETGEIHQPWPTQGNTPDGVPATSNAPGTALYFTDPMPANGSSSPQYVVPAKIPDPNDPTGVIPLSPGKVLYYCCKKHPNAPTERGSIVIF